MGDKCRQQNHAGNETVHGAIQPPGERAGKRSGCKLLTGGLISHQYTVLLALDLGGVTCRRRLAGHATAAFLDDLDQAFEFALRQVRVDG